MEMPPVPWPANTDELDRWAALVAQHPLWDRVVTDTRGRGLARAPRARGRARLDPPGRAVPARRRPVAGPRPGRPHAGPPRRPDRGAAGRRHAEPGRGRAARLPCRCCTTRSGRPGPAAERSVRPHDLTPSQDATSDRAAFERFAQSYSQPHRRAVAAVARGPARRRRGDRLVAAAPLDRPAAGGVPARVARIAVLSSADPTSARRSGSPSCCGRCGPTPASCPGPTATGALAALADDGVRERLRRLPAGRRAGPGDRGGGPARGRSASTWASSTRSPPRR